VERIRVNPPPAVEVVERWRWWKNEHSLSTAAQRVSHRGRYREDHL